MANVIIGIHGIGNKPQKAVLEKWWKNSMIEGLAARKYTKKLPKFELVYWADILHDKPQNLLEKDIHSPYYLAEEYVKAPKHFEVHHHSTRIKVVDYLTKQLNKIFLNADLSLNYSYITDAIMHRYFKDLDTYFTENYTFENQNICSVKDLIKERLLEVLKKYKSHNIMLISHSMGSIIAYDVLNFEAQNVKINTFITMGSPLGLPIVISKIASEQKKRLVTNIQMKTPEIVIKNWFNFSDILDKIAFNYKLNDDFLENSLGIKPIDFLVENNYELDGVKNPHKLYGYLRTPEFAKILNEFNLSEKFSLKESVIRSINQLLKPLQTKLSKPNK